MSQRELRATILNYWRIPLSNINIKSHLNRSYHYSVCFFFFRFCLSPAAECSSAETFSHYCVLEHSVDATSDIVLPTNCSIWICFLLLKSFKTLPTILQNLTVLCLPRSSSQATYFIGLLPGYVFLTRDGAIKASQHRQTKGL